MKKRNQPLNRKEIVALAYELRKRVVDNNHELQYFDFRVVKDSDIVFEIIYSYVDDIAKTIVVGDYSLTHGLRYYRTRVSLRSFGSINGCETCCNIEQGEEIPLTDTLMRNIDELTFMLSYYMRCTLKTMETYFKYSLNKI